MAYRGKSSTAAARAQKSENSINEPKYSDHWITASQKMWKSKDGKFTKDRGETKTFADHASTLSSDSCDSLRRPAVAFSVMASTVVEVTDKLTEWQKQNLVGTSYSWLLKGAAKHRLALEQLDSFAEGVSRDSASVRSASVEVMKWLKALHNSDQAQTFVMTMLDKAVKEMHLARQLIEWMNFAADTSKAAKSIGFKQLQNDPKELERLRSESFSKEHFTAMSTWLANGILKKNTEHAAYSAKSKPRASGIDFSQLSIDSDDEATMPAAATPVSDADSDVPLPQSRSKKPAEPKTNKANEGVTLDQVQSMMSSMMEQFMAKMNAGTSSAASAHDVEPSQKRKGKQDLLDEDHDGGDESQKKKRKTK